MFWGFRVSSLTQVSHREPHYMIHGGGSGGVWEFSKGFIIHTQRDPQYMIHGGGGGIWVLGSGGNTTLPWQLASWRWWWWRWYMGIGVRWEHDAAMAVRWRNCDTTHDQLILPPPSPAGWGRAYIPQCMIHATIHDSCHNTWFMP